MTLGVEPRILQDIISTSSFWEAWEFVNLSKLQFTPVLGLCP